MIKIKKDEVAPWRRGIKDIRVQTEDEIREVLTACDSAWITAVLWVYRPKKSAHERLDQMRRGHFPFTVTIADHWGNKETAPDDVVYDGFELYCDEEMVDYNNSYKCWGWDEYVDVATIRLYPSGKLFVIGSHWRMGFFYDSRGNPLVSLADYFSFLERHLQENTTETS